MQIVFVRVVQVLSKIHFEKFEIILLGYLGKQLHRHIILEIASYKVYVLQEYNQHLSDQGEDVLLFHQQSLDPLRKKHVKNLCAKIEVEL